MLSGDQPNSSVISICCRLVIATNGIAETTELLSASGRWLETNVAERSEAEQPVLKHIERVTELL